MRIDLRTVEDITKTKLEVGDCSSLWFLDQLTPKQYTLPNDPACLA